MGNRVAICALAQVKNEPNVWYQRNQGMLLDCLEPILQQTGVTFDPETGIRNIVSCSDDVFEARTISDAGMGDVLGAHYRGEEKAAQDGLNGLGYAMACILAGHDDMVLFMGHCRESQPESRNMCTNLAYDPFFCRPVGMDYLNVNAFQARAYMEKAGVTEEHLAEVVVRSRENAAKNPYARESGKVTKEDVVNSPFLADPIRELHVYPVTDWAVGMLLCCEERVGEFTDNPVWITGFGNCMDRYFVGDRDLTSNFSLKKASERACGMAGVKDPKTDLDVIELNDAYAHQLPMLAEGIGLAGEGQGGKWIESGGPAKLNVNLSGGMLNGNPIMLGGVARAVEGILQLRGEAGDRQVDGAKRALAHGTTGGACQHQTVLILEK
jgi:acetyl-CoA C-acetyltransferase